MGDVFHLLPALTDAQQNKPGLVIDWVVEKAFAEIPTWHPAVRRVFAIEERKWRKKPLQYRQEKKAFFAQFVKESYDLILDAQGLLKSAWVGRKIRKLLANRPPILGMDWKSAREPLASFFYQRKIFVEKEHHAIKRLRFLLAQTLGYPEDLQSPVDYNLRLPEVHLPEDFPFDQQKYGVFLHGTTWETKLWTEENWQALGQKFNQMGLGVVLPWGTLEEKQRAQRIAQRLAKDQAWLPEKRLSLGQMAVILQRAAQVVAVDTGLSHVAAAVGTPTLVLYRVTSPNKVGAIGNQVRHLVSPLAEKYLKRFSDDKMREASLDNLGVNQVFLGCKGIG